MCLDIEPLPLATSVVWLNIPVKAVVGLGPNAMSGGGALGSGLDNEGSGRTNP